MSLFQRKHHPEESELALLAGGECGRVSRFLLRRHVARCERCASVLESFEVVRLGLSTINAQFGADNAQFGAEPLDFEWGALEAEMRANIRLGL